MKHLIGKIACFFLLPIALLAQGSGSNVGNSNVASGLQAEKYGGSSAHGAASQIVTTNASGDVQAGIPLYVVKGRKLSLPLQLGYQAGIKASQQSGPVGLGWNLSFGSVIRDYGAFEPDYTSTRVEARAEDENGNSSSNKLNSLNEVDHQGVSLGYRGIASSSDASNSNQMTPDNYVISIPGGGANVFWNNSAPGGNLDFKFSAASNWKIEYDTKQYSFDQEYSRVNEAYMNYALTPFGSQYSLALSNPELKWDNSYAAAICVPPHAKQSSFEKALLTPGLMNNTLSSSEPKRKIKYEDFEQFTITDDNGTIYVFGRALRGQKYLFNEDPFWSANEDQYAPGYQSGGSATPPYSEVKGEFWKIDFIAEWLLTEIRSYDFQDLNGNGIADDGDGGDWIRIEYTEPTQIEQNLPGSTLSFETPKHREWSNYTQTDRASSLMRERAYVTKIVTPLEEVDFTISERFDVDMDYFSTILNTTHGHGSNNPFVFSRLTLDGTPDPDLFRIEYPIETMRYDEFTVKQRRNDDISQTIKLNYADQGSSKQLAVSDYVIRDQTNQELGTYELSPVAYGHDYANVSALDNYNAGVGNGRGKTTLLGIEWVPEAEPLDSRSYEFEYGFNPSYNFIHKYAIRQKLTHPTLRQSNPSINAPKNRFEILGPVYNYKSREYNKNGGYVDYQDPNSVCVDEMGYFYHPTAVNEGRDAWSLSNIITPAKGEISLEYERDRFDYNGDRQGWINSGSLIDALPSVNNYNLTAMLSSMAQDNINDVLLPSTTNPVGVKKELYRVFEMSMNDYSGGLRLKKMTMDDGINPEVAMNYNYGTGHYSSVPASYWASYSQAFSSFLLAEQHRHTSKEAGDYGNNLPVNMNEFNFSFSQLAVNSRLGSYVGDKHYYEFVEVVSPDGSKEKNYFKTASSSESEVLYDRQGAVSIKGQSIHDLTMLIINEASGLNTVQSYKKETLSAGGELIRSAVNDIEQTIENQRVLKFKDYVTNGYDELQVNNYSYCVGCPTLDRIDQNDLKITSVLNVTNLIGSQAAVSFPGGFNLAPEYGDIYLPMSLNRQAIINVFFDEIDDWIFFLGNYYANKTMEFKVFDLTGATFATHQTIQSRVISESGTNRELSSSTHYSYNSRNQLRSKVVKNSDYNLDSRQIITERYGYAHEVFTANNLDSEFIDRNMISPRVRTTVFKGEVDLSSSDLDDFVLSDQYIKWSHHSDNNNLYAYGTYDYYGDLKPDGTIANYSSVFNTASVHWLPQATIPQEGIDAYGLPDLSLGQGIYSKAVYGYSNSLTKASFSLPSHRFDATYTGFEDMEIDIETPNNIHEKWTNQTNSSKVGIENGGHTGEKQFFLKARTNNGEELLKSPIRAVKMYESLLFDNAIYKASVWAKSSSGSFAGGDVKLRYVVWNSHRNEIKDQGYITLSDLNSTYSYYEMDIDCNSFLLVPLGSGSSSSGGGVASTANDNYYLLEVYVENSRYGPSSLSAAEVNIDDLLVYPEEATYTYSSFNDNNNPTWSTDANDRSVQTRFDHWGRVSEQRNTQGLVVSKLSYHQSSDLNESHHHVKTTNYLDNGKYHEEISYFDAFGKLKQSIRNNPSEGYSTVLQSLEYDNSGRLSKAYKSYALNTIDFPDKIYSNYKPKAEGVYLSDFPFTSYTYLSDPAEVVGQINYPKDDDEGAISTQSEIEINNAETVIVFDKAFIPGKLRRIKRTDALGFQSYTYVDKWGRTVATKTPISTGNYAETFFDYDELGRLLQVKDPEGKITSYKYNSLGLPIQMNHPDKGITSYVYDRYGKLRFTQTAADKAYQPIGKEQFSYQKYDDWNRMEEAGVICKTFSIPSDFKDYNKINNQNYPNIATEFKKVKAYTFDGLKADNAVGALIKTEVFTDHILTGAGFIPQETDVYEYTYTDEGQLLEEKTILDGLAGVHRLSFEYSLSGLLKNSSYKNSLSSSLIDDNNYDFKWRYEYDDWGRIAQEYSGRLNEVTKDADYNYDVLGHLFKKSIGKENIVGDTYLEYLRYNYDIRDQLTTQLGNRFKFNLEYNKNGFITVQQWDNNWLDNTGSGAFKRHQYRYSFDYTGQLSQANYSELSYASNPFAFYESESSEVPGKISCSLEPVGYVDKLVKDLGNIGVIVKSDAASRISKVIGFLSDQLDASGIQFHLETKAKQDVFIADAYREATNLRLDIDEAHVLNRLDPGTVRYTKLEHTRFLIKNVSIVKSDNCHINTKAIAYNQLQTTINPSVLPTPKYDGTYQYDKAGNIQTLNRVNDFGVNTLQTYNYNLSNNQLNAVSFATSGTTVNAAYTYDANGNLLSDLRSNVSSIHYQAFHNLPRRIIKTSGDQIDYRYNGNDHRVVKINSNGDREYYVGPVVLNQAGIPKRFSNSTGFSTMPEAGSVSANHKFYHIKDWLGSVRYMFDDGGLVANTHDYYPFGKLMPGRIYVSAFEATRYQFTGHEFDGSTQYGYHGARYYNRELGRYMSTDRFASDFPSWAAYHYTHNNPIIFVDPNGDFWHIVAGGIIGGVINLATNWDKIDNFGEGLAAFGAGAASGALTAAFGPGGAALGGALLGATNSVIGQLGGANNATFADVSWGDVTLNGFAGAASGLIGHGVGSWATKSFGSVVINSLTINANTLTGQIILGAIGGGAGGGAGGFAAGFILSGGDVNVALESAQSGFIGGLAIGGALGGGGYVKGKISARAAARKNATLSTTERLQSYVTKAAKEVDALGDEAFTPRQLQAIKRHPYLRAMFRGNRIDVKVRGMIKNDPALSHLQSNYNKGPDFVDPLTGRWWDITTPGAWPAHVRKYGDNGTILPTID